MTPLPWHMDAAKEIELEFTKKRDVPWKVGIREDIASIIAEHQPVSREIWACSACGDRALEIIRLRSQFEALRQENERLREDFAAYTRNTLGIHKASEALREALDLYGMHREECAYGPNGEKPCDCGLAEALSATKEAPDAKP